MIAVNLEKKDELMNDDVNEILTSLETRRVNSFRAILINTINIITDV